MGGHSVNDFYVSMTAGIDDTIFFSSRNASISLKTLVALCVISVNCLLKSIAGKNSIILYAMQIETSLSII